MRLSDRRLNARCRRACAVEGGQAHEPPDLLVCNALFLRAVFILRSAAELGENVLREHTRAADLYSLSHELAEKVFTLLVDRCQISHVDHQFASIKSGEGSLPCRLHFAYPGSNELAFDDQSSLRPGVDDRDLEHDSDLLVMEARAVPTCRGS